MLIEVAFPDTYPHYSELKAGSEAIKRIIQEIDEAQQYIENAKTLKTLTSRVDDWKGLHVEDLGSLLMSDILTVTKAGIDRKYIVVLFERVVLFIKELPPSGPLNKKGQKSIPSFNTTTPLALKGRVFIKNINQVVPVSTTRRTC